MTSQNRNSATISPYDPNDETVLSSDGLLFQRAVRQWGVDSQIEMVIEELTELILAIQKWKRRPSETTVARIADEVADVELMIGQLQYVMDSGIERKYGIHLDESRGYKRLRLRLRLDGKDDALADVAYQVMSR